MMDAIVKSKILVIFQKKKNNFVPDLLSIKKESGMQVLH